MRFARWLGVGTHCRRGRWSSLPGRGGEGWRGGEAAEERGRQGHPPAAATLRQGSPGPREESCEVAGLLQTPV